MQDPDAAVTELRRSIEHLGFKGAMVNGFSQVGTPDTVVYLDDARYLPFWDAAERLNVPLYLHPRDPLISREPIYEGHPWLMGSAWAYTVETATHALRLMCSGLFDRHPGVTIILGHMGEALPSAVWRTDQRLRVTPRGVPAKRRIAEYMCSNFYFTITGVFCAPSLIHTILHMGADRILFSVDYPFIETAEAVKFMDEAPISETDRIKIARTNAAKLFKLQYKAR
jgi:2,3-dihydroxybenzoate decarboxylase